MWKNKHVVVAMLIAPVLAILAWFAVDWFVAERPHVAEPGRDYPLIAKSNCRYASGRCDLVNEEFRLRLEPLAGGADRLTLQISSRYPLASATVGLATDAATASEPVAFAADDAQATLWTGDLPAPSGPGGTLQLVVNAAGSRYYAEVPTVFLSRP